MRRLTTPGGETVSVIPDDEFIRRANEAGAAMTPRSLYAWADARRPLLGALWLHGPAEDSSGRATGLLHERATALGYKGRAEAVPPSLRDADAAVVREQGGRRTYRIGLGTLPQSWADRLVADTELARLAEARRPQEPEDVAEPGTPEPVAEEASPEEVPATAEESPPPEPAWDLEVTSAVAMSLLTKVVEIVSTGSNDDVSVRLRSERDEARERLRQQTEYAEKLRRQLRDSGDELAAVKRERDGLRQRLRLTEENLRKATSPDVQRQVDALVRQQLDRVMRAAPAGSHGSDAA